MSVVFTPWLCRSSAISLALLPVPRMSAFFPFQAAPLSKPSE